MAGYYTTCRFTDTYGYSYNSSFRYPNAPHGFLFHSADRDIEVTDILKPLFRLARLHKPSRQALVLRVDGQTLVATFSLRGFPTPMTVKKYPEESRVYPTGDDDLKGWLIRNISSLTLDPVPVDIGELYDMCLQLTRHAGQCPCDLLSTGECYTGTVKPRLPVEFDDNVMTIDHGELPDKVFKTVDYKTLYGFDFVTSGVTTDKDFAKAHRAWDEHDFNLIESRRDEFSKRGKERKRLNTFRKEHCDKCMFGWTKTYEQRPSIQDCGQINFCDQHTTIEMAEAALAKWYREVGFDNITGFTTVQRDYLITLSGLQRDLRYVFSNARRTAVKFGYFQRGYDGKWQYSLMAAAGDLTREKMYPSYAALREDVPSLSLTPKPTRLNYKAKLGCAIFGTRTSERGGWGCSYIRSEVVVKEHGVESSLCNTRSTCQSEYLSFDKDNIENWVMKALQTYSGVPKYLNETSD